MFTILFYECGQLKFLIYLDKREVFWNSLVFLYIISRKGKVSKIYNKANIYRETDICVWSNIKSTIS